MKRRLIFILIITSVCAAALSANSVAETYTLDQCVNIALKNNYDVIAAEKSYNTARVRVYSAYGSLLPSISISAGASRSWSGFTRTDQTTGEIVGGGETRYIYSGSLNFGNTFDGLGLSNYGSIKKSRSDRASSFYGYVKSQQDLIFNVKSDYYDLIKTKMLLDVAQDAVKRGEEQLRTAQSKYDLGSASMSDVLKAKVQYGNDKLDLVSKTNDYKLAQANLAFLMGINVDQEFEVDENVPDRDINLTFDDAMKEALSQNPQYKIAQFDFLSAKSSRTIAKSRFLPNLSVGLTHGTSVGDYSDFATFRGRDASYRLSAGLSFNIFNGGSDYANLNAAKNEVRTKEENLDNTKNSVALELKKSFLELERAREAKTLADESVAAAQEDLNLVREKYNLGAATILEVLDSEVSFKEAQTNNVQAIFDYNLAVAQLEKALGR